MRGFVKKLGLRSVNTRGRDTYSRNVRSSETQMNESPQFFIHIPKTAGTSFKKAVSEFYGEKNIIRNYGSNSSETDIEIKKALDGETFLGDLDSILNADGSFKIYLGHVHAQSARHLFQSTNVFAFLRNPVDQVVSHYNHYRRWYNYKGSLRDFVTTAGFQNVQSKYLRGIPLYITGLIGLTESFEDSINLYNHYYKANLEVRNDNVNGNRVIDKVCLEDQSLIKACNKEDLDLYEKAKILLDQRIDLLARNLIWTFGYIHRYNAEKNVIFGVAFQVRSEKPIQIDLMIDGVKADTVKANQFRPGFAHWNVPNFNHIGFQFSLPKGKKPEDIDVLVAGTGQKLLLDY